MAGLMKEELWHAVRCKKMYLLRPCRYLEAAMQRRHTLRANQWERITDALPGKVEAPGRTAQIIDYSLKPLCRIAKTGASWRDLPSEYGKWSNAHKRFMRWSQKGVWQMIFNTLAVKCGYGMADDRQCDCTSPPPCGRC